MSDTSCKFWGKNKPFYSLFTFHCEFSLFVADISDEKSLGACVFHRTNGKVDLVWKIQDCTSADGSHGNDEFFTLCDAHKFMCVVLQKRKACIQNFHSSEVVGKIMGAIKKREHSKMCLRYTMHQRVI